MLQWTGLCQWLQFFLSYVFFGTNCQKWDLSMDMNKLVTLGVELGSGGWEEASGGGVQHRYVRELLDGLWAIQVGEAGTGFSLKLRWELQDRLDSFRVCFLTNYLATKILQRQNNCYETEVDNIFSVWLEANLKGQLQIASITACHLVREGN